MKLPLPPVLVVDDEKNMRASIKTVLTDDGYPVRAVESAEEALNLLAHEDFTMIITDARLGGWVTTSTQNSTFKLSLEDSTSGCVL